MQGEYLVPIKSNSESEFIRIFKKKFSAERIFYANLINTK